MLVNFWSNPEATVQLLKTPYFSCAILENKTRKVVIVFYLLLYSIRLSYTIWVLPPLACHSYLFFLSYCSAEHWKEYLLNSRKKRIASLKHIHIYNYCYFNSYWSLNSTCRSTLPFSFSWNSLLSCSFHPHYKWLFPSQS